MTRYFLLTLVKTVIEPIFARDRVREAIERNLEALADPFEPVLAARFNNDVFRGPATAELSDLLHRVATHNPNLRFSEIQMGGDRI
jgi:hypothetical protein